MINFVTELVDKGFVEVTPMQFYRDIFPRGLLDTAGAYTKGKYVGIAIKQVVGADGKKQGHRHIITDDLNKLEMLLACDNFVYLSPIGYFGHKRLTDNAAIMTAFAIEIDDIRRVDGVAVGLNDMLYQMDNDILPRPNYMVASGNGLHLYYIFDDPLILYDNVKRSLVKFKDAFTKVLWNRYITDLWEEEKIQYESAFQAFRLAGGTAKNGERTRVFKVHDTPISVDELNRFVPDEAQIEVKYKSRMTIDEAKVNYPEWYQRRIVDGKDKGSWTCKRDLYDWWLRRIRTEAVVGHRYYCIMCLAIYAIKSGIDYDELEADALSLVDRYNAMSQSDPFTVDDVMAALQIYQDKGYVTYPRDVIAYRSGIKIDKNVRHYRKQDIHLFLARNRKQALKAVGEMRPEGRPSKENIVKQWRQSHPDGRKIDCHRATGISRVTIDKWWDSALEG